MSKHYQWLRWGQRIHNMIVMIVIPHKTIEFTLRPREPFRPPAFDGSMLRGAFGHSLRRLVCVMRRRSCDGCPLFRGCAYVRIFETPGGDAPAGLVKAPHPFVLRATLREKQEGLEKGKEADAPLRFGMRLFGQARDDEPFIVRSVEEMARRGLGPSRVPFSLEEVRVGTLAEAPRLDRLSDRIRLKMVTPLRLREAGALADTESLDGPLLARAISRRVTLMAEFHGLGRPDELDRLRAESAHVRIADRHLQWRRLWRKSARQKCKQAIGGLVGEVVLDLRAAPGLRELAAWAPVVHLGKGTSMGLGAVELEAA